MADNDWQYIAISDTVAALRNRYSRHVLMFMSLAICWSITA